MELHGIPGGRIGREVYASKRWKVLRWEVLRSNGFRCGGCGSNRHLEVDHVVPLAKAPERAYDVENLQVLCKTCHGRKTRYENNGPQDPERERWRDLLNEV